MKRMQFKVNLFGYWFLNVMYGLVFAFWAVLAALYPPGDPADWGIFLRYLAGMELLFFLCSPFLQRRVRVDGAFITETWLWWKVDRLPLSAIRDVGLCLAAVSGHARQYVFLSSAPVTDAQAFRLYEERRWRHKGFFTVDYPQKGLDAFVSGVKAQNGLPDRPVSWNGSRSE